MKRAWNTLKLFYFLRRISKDPKDTGAVFGVAACAYQLDLIKELTQKANLNPNSVKIISERKLLEKVNLLELQKLPSETLGRAYADHMLSQGLALEFYEVVEFK
jgi:ubiquinone biosynthesis protein Coq4